MIDASRHHGFTLLEVMVAIIILGILAITSSSSISYAAKIRMRARQQQAALIEANSLLERAMAKAGKSTCPSGDTGFLDANMNYSSGNPNMTRHFDNDDPPMWIKVTNDEDFLHIEVFVSYGSGSVELEGYKCVMESEL